mmetsp:Transcript_66009/g.76682  ORF Transcript_66009/g.76682 Transcript_66009/m.76682 type:complete len:212 (+) Transcript_66009:26-661(+)|eukprot:CAMPEP_0176447568 /NCGR_PEP_ID=MMETSP0127-20121128/25133_1 /TAXON_ID=938130 /ORGANISM="Platyophrya macrostoma, Strain WH" /LENGTH=211 /DNA_ID=CAMNT_0017834087 /DNA_START=24 /DNA_END=659 /DNA_ORIENTATION=+
MNPIQKAWLQILSPFAYVINEKLAKRSGVLGKIGKFFIIGPRQYGVHPFNKLLIYLNRKYIHTAAFLLHRYPIYRALTGNGYNMMRPLKHGSILGPLAVFFGIYRFVYHPVQFRGYEPDQLTYLNRKIGGYLGIPTNSLNQVTSAHFIEINVLYAAEMAKRYHTIHGKILADRARQTDEVRKTKYADPSYKYIAGPQNIQPRTSTTLFPSS